MNLFPSAVGSAANGGARAALGVLFRLERSARSDGPCLLMQSRLAPDWGRLPEHYLAEVDYPTENPECKSVAKACGSLRNGQVLAFRLLANPAYKAGSTSKCERLAGAPKQNGTRVPLEGEQAQVHWLTRKGEQYGFKVETVRLRPNVLDVRTDRQGTVRGRRSRNGQQQGLVLRAVLFEGRLRIMERLLFAQALEGGIGSGKAYGFGLLSVMQPR